MDQLRAAAEEALSAAWGGRVSCAIIDTLPGSSRSRVYRLSVTGGPVASVILKASIGRDGGPYVARDPTPGGPFQRLCNDWAGGEMLGPLGLGPNVYAGDSERGFCLLEDLGEGETLAQRLSGSDPASATEALFAYARSLGEMHAATRGQERRWADLLEEKGARNDNNGPIATPWRSAAQDIRVFCEEIGMNIPAALETDVAEIFEKIDRNSEYLAFTPADCCPENHFLRGDRVVFFDCEFAGMRHALLDAAYVLAPFPTCSCCAALPDDLPPRLIAAYREGFAGGPDFEDEMTLALAAWLTNGLMAHRFTGWDSAFGLSTLRQRVQVLIGQLLARPNFNSVAPKLAELVADWDKLLRVRWSALPPMPKYPAFA